MSQRDGANGRGAPDSKSLGSPPASASKTKPSAPPSGAVDVSAATMASGSVAPNGHADTMISVDESASLERSGTDSLVGETLSERYRVTRRIGKGGMGAVYEATHVKIGKRMAIKVLLDKYQEREQVVARLEQEARLASSIGHEHIIDITDFGQTVDGRTFVAMEYLEGESLGQLIARGPVEPTRAIEIARQIASALGAAHDKGIIHRDIKPDNVFLLQRKGRDFVKVVDFGISKSVAVSEDAGDSPRLTQTGMVLGTPLYMSPEQARGDDDLDKRIDLYAVGVILYEMVTGEVPFSGSNYLSVLSQVVSDEPPAPSERSDIGDDLEAVILKAMAKDRDDRYASMAELDHDLALLQESDPRASVPGLGITAARRKRPRSRVRALWAVAGISVIAAAVVFTVSMLLGDDEQPTPPVAAIAPAPAPDAAPKPPTPDAAVAKPEFEIAEIRIVSTPPGATIYADGGGRVVGVAPIPFRTEKKPGKVELIAELKGHDDTSVTISPMVDDGRTVKMRLRRTKKGAPRRRLVNRPSNRKVKDDKPKKDDGTAGGDLSPDPYAKQLGDDE